LPSSESSQVASIASSSGQAIAVFLCGRSPRLEAAGGYRTDTVGEDMELVVRLHRWHRRKRLPYRIRYLPDPICWTEAPEDLGTLGRQRSRWQRGLAESLMFHPPWRFGWRAGAAGYIAWPFMALFEWVGPLIELSGYAFMIVGFAMSWVSPIAFKVFIAVALGMGILLSVNGLLLETLSFRVYNRSHDMLSLRWRCLRTSATGS